MERLFWNWDNIIYLLQSTKGVIGRGLQNTDAKSEHGKVEAPTRRFSKVKGLNV